MSKADAPGRDHAALVGIEGRHAADRKAVAPVGVRHDIGGLNDSGQHGDIARLLGDLVIHVADEGLVGIDDGRHAHGAGRFDTPGRGINAGKATSVHGRLQLHVDHAARRPPAVGFPGHLERRIGGALGL
jgi:hypothetical protein